MTARRPGRPPAEAAPLDETALVAAGLALLDQGGEAAVTVRGVARRLDVTPMAVSYRTGGRDGLLARVLIAAHDTFDPPNLAGAIPEEVADAVNAYVDAARQHPNAVVAIFRRPDLMPPSLAIFTVSLRSRIAEADPEAADRGVALLIDYAHGHLLAASRGETPAMKGVFEENLLRLARWLLA